MNFGPSFLRCRRFFLNLFVIVAFGMVTTVSVYAQNAEIRWYSMQEAQKMARQHDKKVFVFAETSWCIYCKKMHNEVFPKQAVIDSLDAYFFPVKIDMESDKTMDFNGKKITGRQFAQAYKVHATPTTFFVDKKGGILGKQPGFIPANTFSKLLAFVGSDAFQKMDFKIYLKKHTKPTEAGQ